MTRSKWGVEWGWIGQVVVVLAGVEWLRAPSMIWVGLMAGGTLLVLLSTSPGGPRRFLPRFLTVVLLLVTGFAVPIGSLLESPSPEKISRKTRAAEAELTQALNATLVRLEALVQRVADLAPFGPEHAFGDLQRMVPKTSPGVALAILDQAGRTEVWAGDHRVIPSSSSPGIVLTRRAYYEILEVRRQRRTGGYAVASTVLAVDSSVPFPVPSLAGLLEERRGFVAEFLSLEDGATDAIPWPSRDPVLLARPILHDPATVSAGWTETAMRTGGWLLLAIIVSVVLTSKGPASRFGFLLLMLWVTIRAPLAEVMGWVSGFDSATFFSTLLGPLSTTAGSLAFTGMAFFVAAVWLWHRRGRWHGLVVPLVTAAVVGTPLLLREFGRGITPPSDGVPLGLWLSWHVALLLPTAGVLVLGAALLRRNRRLGERSAVAALGGAAAVIAATVGLIVFDGRPGWPGWYVLLWIPSVFLAVWPARRVVSVTVLAVTAGAGASLVTWGAALSGRTDVAVRDLDGLGPDVDPLVEPLLAEFGARLADGPVIESPTDLFGRWRAGAVANQRYPVRLALWSAQPEELAANGGRPVSVGRVVLDALAVDDTTLLRLATASLSTQGPTVTRISAFPGVHYLLTAPLPGDRFATALVGPRSALIERAPLGRVLGAGFVPTSLYRLSLAPAPVGRFAVPEGQWRREGWTLRMWRSVPFADGLRETHALIPLGTPPWLFVRGAILLFADVALIGLLWLFAERIVGVPRRAVDWRKLSRSFRAQLAVALAAWCIIPASLLAGLSTIQLGSEARRSRELVLQRVLRDAIPADGFEGETAALELPLRDQAMRVDADLGLYHQGFLAATSEPILRDLGLFSPLLEGSAYDAIHLHGDLTAFPRTGPAGGLVRASYAAVPTPGASIPAVLATLSPGKDPVLRERQIDVAALLILATVIGILAAIVGARRASLALSRPVTDLRRAALAFGAGHDPAVSTRHQPPEFEPVFDAFGRMAKDVRAAQLALETARSRTDAVLGTVTTGVVAVDADGRILLANRQAEDALARLMVPGEPLEASLAPDWAVVASEVARRLDGEAWDEAEVELVAGDRRFVVQFAPLGSSVGGLVLAINDITESTRAARVLAWGEVASQVAHAIKNPLTPVRLGIQHLQKVRSTHPAQLPSALDETVGRIIGEIDRLDGIARAFSRFAAPGTPDPVLESVELLSVVGEAEALYRLVPGVTVGIEISAGARGPARKDELKEVLLNLFDNARNAGAKHITVRGSDTYVEVVDDGEGISAELLPRVFEPRFSSTSSGSGLGLAIVRRLVEGWGGSVSIESEVGQGTTVRVELAEAAPA